MNSLTFAIREVIAALSVYRTYTVGLADAQTAVGLLDPSTATPRLAMTHPDREEYAASVAKIGILLGSLMSAVLGFVVLRLVTRPRDPAESESA